MSGTTTRGDLDEASEVVLEAQAQGQVQVQVQVQVLEQEREGGARWPVAVRRVHLRGLGRPQPEPRRGAPANPDGMGLLGTCRQGAGRREGGCGSMRER